MKKYYLGVDDIRVNDNEDLCAAKQMESIDVVLNNQIHRYITDNVEVYVPDKHGQEVFDLLLKICNMGYENCRTAFGTGWIEEILALGYTTVRDKYETWKKRNEVKEMTIEEISKALGHKVKIVSKEDK